ncbi:hypothetical protein, partial [Burkholderia sp. SIMBA_048]|uniref:hypothetical protein n=1 Tax=Burkholderia sp. SIMBA_048 TaxID=3085789 RepID=UPI00397D8925
RGYRERVEAQSQLARERWQLDEARRMLSEANGTGPDAAFDSLIDARTSQMGEREKALLDAWPDTVAAYSGDEHVVKIRDK